jgi:hypothetical protein
MEINPIEPASMPMKSWWNEVQTQKVQKKLVEGGTAMQYTIYTYNRYGQLIESEVRVQQLDMRA